MSLLKLKGESSKGVNNHPELGLIRLSGTPQAAPKLVFD